MMFPNFTPGQVCAARDRLKAKAGSGKPTDLCLGEMISWHESELDCRCVGRGHSWPQVTLQSHESYLAGVPDAGGCRSANVRYVAGAVACQIATASPAIASTHVYNLGRELSSSF